MDLSLSPLPARLRVWLFKDVENVKQLRDSIIGKAPAEEGGEGEGDKKDEERGKPKLLLTFPDASFLDASLVPDLWTLRLAAFAAEAAGRRGRARSRSRHTELVVALSGGKNISAALATFGLSDSARHLLVARFVDEDDGDKGDGDGKGGDDKGNAGANDDEETSAAFAAAVRGTPVPAPELEAALASVSDAAAQARAFKVAVAGEEDEGRREGGGGAGGGGAGGGGGRGGRLVRGEAAASSGAGTTTTTAAIVEVGPLRDAAACRIALRDC